MRAFFKADPQGWIELMAISSGPLPETVCRTDLAYWLNEIERYRISGGARGRRSLPSRRSLMRRWRQGERWVRTRLKRWLTPGSQQGPNRVPIPAPIPAESHDRGSQQGPNRVLACAISRKEVKKTTPPAPRMSPIPETKTTPTEEENSLSDPTIALERESQNLPDLDDGAREPSRALTRSRDPNLADLAALALPPGLLDVWTRHGVTLEALLQTPDDQLRWVKGVGQANQRIVLRALEDYRARSGSALPRAPRPRSMRDRYREMIGDALAQETHPQEENHHAAK